MVDGADVDKWSEISEAWARLWGAFARPVHVEMARAAGIGPGSRVLDVGCGGGEFLSLIRELGARAYGVDPAPGMRAVAVAAGHDAFDGDAEHLPFGAGEFDVVVAVNALQFAADTTIALTECARVVAPGGRVAVANWAEASRNDLDVIERAVADADGSSVPPDGPLRATDGLEVAFGEAGVKTTKVGLTETTWRAESDDLLVEGVLLGASPTFIAEMRPVVIAAARPFRDGDGYTLRNAFRWAVGTPV